MVKNFVHNLNLNILFSSLDSLGVPYKATILENSVFTQIDDSGNELKVKCLVDNFDTLND